MAGLVLIPDRKLREAKRRTFHRLHRVLRDTPHQESAERAGRETGADLQATQERIELVTLVQQVLELQTQNQAQSAIFQQWLREELGGLIETSEASDRGLRHIAAAVFSMADQVQRIDLSLQDDLPKIRADVLQLRKAFAGSAGIPENEKQTILGELDEMVKVKSAGTIVFKVPLIPGVLEYSKSLDVSVDWNKWLQKLGALWRNP